MLFTVYKLTNSINGKCYIGITSRKLNARWAEHLERHRQGSRPNNRLYAALAKYGPKAFQVEAVAYAFSEEEVRRLETEYIKKFNSYKRGYNCNLGGHGFLKFPDDIRRKIGAAQKGKIIPQDVRDKMSLAKLGDKRCALHFGKYISKGSSNPKAKSYLIKFPNGTEHVVTGMRDFCRQHSISLRHMRARGRTKGYVVLRRFNDYPEREYTQAGGNGGGPGISRIVI